jgi:hypothetical protein
MVGRSFPIADKTANCCSKPKLSKYYDEYQKILLLFILAAGKKKCFVKI